jgi:hypothetical protein
MTSAPSWAARSGVEFSDAPGAHVLLLVSYGAGMSVHAGRHRLGTDRDRIVLRTFRDGATGAQS